MICSCNWETWKNAPKTKITDNYSVARTISLQEKKRRKNLEVSLLSGFSWGFLALNTDYATCYLEWSMLKLSEKFGLVRANRDRRKVLTNDTPKKETLIFSKSFDSMRNNLKLPNDAATIAMQSTRAHFALPRLQKLISVFCLFSGRFLLCDAIKRMPWNTS